MADAGDRDALKFHAMPPPHEVVDIDAGDVEDVRERIVRHGKACAFENAGSFLDRST